MSMPVSTSNVSRYVHTSLDMTPLSSLSQGWYPGPSGRETRRTAGFPSRSRGYGVGMTSAAGPPEPSESNAPAEQPPTDEVAVARGRVEQTPFSMINWVGIVIGAVVVLALVVVVAAYLIA